MSEMRPSMRTDMEMGQVQKMQALQEFDFATPICFIEATIQQRLQDELDSRFGDEDSYAVNRYLEPYVLRIIDTCGTEITRLIYENPTLSDFRESMDALLTHNLGRIIDDVRNNISSRIEDTMAVAKMRDAYRTLRPVPKYEALKKVEEGNISPITEKDFIAFRTLYRGRMMGEEQAAKILEKGYDELRLWFRPGRFLAPPDDEEIPRLKQLLENNKRMEAKSRMPPGERFNRETMVGMKLEIDGQTRAIGWYSVSPRDPELDKPDLDETFKKRITKICAIWPSASDALIDNLRKGTVAELEMILSDIEYGALFLMTKLHKKLRERFDDMESPASNILSYYLQDIRWRCDGKKMEKGQQSVAFTNKASHTLLTSDCGYTDAGTSVLDWNNAPAVKFTVSPQKCTAIEAPTEVEIFARWKRVNGIPSEVFAETDRKWEARRSMRPHYL